MAHGTVTAAFTDFFRLGIELGKIILVHEIRHIAAALINFHIRAICTVKESCLAKGILIEIREECLNTLFQFCVCFAVRHCRNWEIYMELRSCRLAVLFLHVVTAIADKECAVGKCHSHIKGINPISRIIRVVIVAVLGKNIGVLEIIVATVIALVSATNMVKFDGLHKRSLVRDVRLIGIDAVGTVSGSACSV